MAMVASNNSATAHAQPDGASRTNHLRSAHAGAILQGMYTLVSLCRSTLTSKSGSNTSGAASAYRNLNKSGINTTNTDCPISKRPTNL
jgi:hypothetical protein